MVPMKWLKLSYLGLLWIVLSAALEIHPSVEFSRHTLIKPTVRHGREKREISSTKETEDGTKHVDFLTLTIPLHSENVILDLRLNRDLIPKNYFEKHQSHEGGYVTKYPKAHEIELCHYNGNIRGVRNSWVAVSTCNGIRGVIFDGEEMHYIENNQASNSTKLTDPHLLYKHSDLISSENASCGFKNTPRFAPKDTTIDVHSPNHRVRRDTSSSYKVHGPYNANKQSRYIELVMVIDNKEFQAFNEDTTRVYQHCKDITNIVNSLYVPLNIFIALVGVVIWSRADEIALESNGDKTLTNFLNYRKDRLLKDHPNDNAQLLTRMQFSDGVVGKALKGPICTFEFSGGINVDHSSTLGVVASTVAHEMGHNLGMEHDTSDCTCPSERCIMSPSSSSSTTTTEWSSCSVEYLTVAFEHGMDYCLRNKPESLFESPVCGNGFVEPGEQCDCGLKEKCNNPCCNVSTCMLHANASCATGECCDLQTCKPHTAGTMCRSAERECDLPEYCTGQSEYCPDDVYKVDGEPCNKAMAYCYKGNCRSHSDQCRLLWGPSGQSSDMQCYQQNVKGNRSGNCGYNRLNMSYVKCKDENVYCGMLQCKHFNEKLEFGMESVAILSHFFISVDSSVIPCRTAIVDLGLNEVDPGLTPDGAKCGENKMCLNQKCMEIDSLRAISTPGACPHNCNGNGVCNSKGHCHCKDGFAPPFCDGAGVGGSEDSGPAANPYSNTSLSKIFWYMMAGLALTATGLFGYSYHTRKSPSYFWKRGQRRTVYVPYLDRLENCRWFSCSYGFGGGPWSSWNRFKSSWWGKPPAQWNRNTPPKASEVFKEKHVTIPRGLKPMDIVHIHLDGSSQQNIVKQKPYESSQPAIGHKISPRRGISKSDIKPVIINARELPSQMPHTAPEYDEEHIYAEIGSPVIKQSPYLEALPKNEDLLSNTSSLPGAFRPAIPTHKPSVMLKPVHEAGVRASPLPNNPVPSINSRKVEQVMDSKRNGGLALEDETPIGAVSREGSSSVDDRISDVSKAAVSKNDLISEISFMAKKLRSTKMLDKGNEIEDLEAVVPKVITSGSVVGSTAAKLGGVSKTSTVQKAGASNNALRSGDGGGEGEQKAEDAKGVNELKRVFEKR